MKRDIIGIDVTIEFSDGEKGTGHLSPTGVHIHRDQPSSRLSQPLAMMRESIEGAFRPYRNIRDDARTR